MNVKIEVNPRTDLRDSKELTATYDCGGKMYKKTWIFDARADLDLIDMSIYHKSLEKAIKRRNEAKVA